MIEIYNIWQNYWVEKYYKIRYGASWRWYYLNWEQNYEFLP